ncbi:PREDICTED: uncharacterized protein LOC108614779 [Drosophila arizonae]|uniref:Uncharacterized protein LOC108614779 n=1 Tax=Drosophila arizonae TaxID=7263 RepID=A0ABM1PBC9_DROAR|nr:PREDICTED: uncharacterized protein LOC108614779 [Drosophila arizonae]
MECVCFVYANNQPIEPPTTATHTTSCGRCCFPNLQLVRHNQLKPTGAPALALKQTVPAPEQQQTFPNCLTLKSPIMQHSERARASSSIMINHFLLVFAVHTLK